MEKVGFIGLGIMGKPMVFNLLKAGYDVGILETSNAAEEVSTAGAREYKNAQDLARDVDVIITMLPDSPEVITLSQEVMKGVKKGALFIDMSTISPAVSIDIYSKMQELGVDALDAPVSGGQVGAEAGTLSIMVGGKQEAFDRALPIFNAMGKNIVLIGEAGAGQTTKACNQLIVGMTIQAVAEAFTLGKKAGVNLVKMREALLGGFAQSRILDLHGLRLIEENFAPGFKIKLHKKDMGIASQAGKDYELNLPGTTLISTLMEQAVKEGIGELDHSSLALLIK
jgi:2-hydroxy-3-oxopropionate reductase